MPRVYPWIYDIVLCHILPYFVPLYYLISYLVIIYDGTIRVTHGYMRLYFVIFWSITLYDIVFCYL